eukprot:11019616-Alexandrium_andersonii.AAC.1
MSASLVGSEMCIRDSYPPEKRLQLARRPVSSSPSNSARKMMPHPPDAVSYTHLTLPTICSV